MSQDILHVDFLKGVKKDEFNLHIISHFATESGGNPWMNQYDLVLNDNFFLFWDYIRVKYAVNSRDLISNPTKAKVEQKTKGIDNKGYPWTNSLLVSDDTQTEVTVFYPHTCSLLGEVEVEEYREYVKSLTELSDIQILGAM